MYKDYLNRREKIIISAIEILDEKGIQGLTTKEIAKRQGITEPAIYRQFNNKEEIICAIIEKFAAFDDMIVNTIKEKQMQPREGIVYFIDAYSTYYENYPQIAMLIFSLEILKYTDKVNEKMSAILKKRQDFVSSLLNEGIVQGQFKKGLEPHELTEILFGTFSMALYNWKIDNCKTDLKLSIIKKTNWLLEQISAN